MRFSRFFLAGGQSAVPLSGWFLGGWSPGTTLVLFWFENLALTIFIAARIAVHWRATRTRGHTGGYLTRFLGTSLAFTLAHGVFLAVILGALLPGSVDRADVVTGLEWMLGMGVASLLVDLWRIGSWPFAEVRARVDWMQGRVVLVHLSILGGMLLYAAAGEPHWFFSIFVALKGLADLSSLVPRWTPVLPPATAAEAPGLAARPAGRATFRDHWRRALQVQANAQARDEEVVPDA